MHRTPRFWGVQVPWVPCAAKGHAGGSLMVPAQGREGSSLCQPRVPRHSAGCKATGCPGGSLLLSSPEHAGIAVPTSTTAGLGDIREPVVS